MGIDKINYIFYLISKIENIKIIKYFLFIILFFFSLQIYSQTNNKPSLMGRVIIDGGVFLSQRDTLNSGTNFTDIRIGIKGTINNNWYYKFDIGYSSNKVSAKDVFWGYRCKNHQFQIGQFYEPFSMDLLVSSVDMKFQQTAGIVYALGNMRKLGLSYTYNIPKLNFVFGFFSDNNSSNLRRFSNAYSFHSRVIYRPLNSEKKLIHVSLAPSWKFTDRNIILASPSFIIIDEKPFSYVNFSDSKYQFRIGAEYLMNIDRFSLMCEYMMTTIFLDNYNYTAHGGYVECAYILFGNLYNYDNSWGCVARPDGKSLELVARYNYQNLDDTTVNVYGGELQDLSIGLNYYINKYFAIKINYNYLIPIEHVKNIQNKPFSLVQMRIQFVL